MPSLFKKSEFWVALICLGITDRGWAIGHYDVMIVWLLWALYYGVKLIRQRSE